MTAAVARLPVTDQSQTSDSTVRPAAVFDVQPDQNLVGPWREPSPVVSVSARGEATIKASDLLSDFINQLCIDYRLTAGEVAVILAAEMAGQARAQVARERQYGEGIPVATRFLKPRGDDAKVDEAMDVADFVTETAVQRA